MKPSISFPQPYKPVNFTPRHPRIGCTCKASSKPATGITTALSTRRLRLAGWVQSLPDSLKPFTVIPEELLQSVLEARVDPKAGCCSIHQLLFFTALLHDLGKAEAFQRMPDGTTRCPGHEAISAGLAKKVCSRFDLSSQETGWVNSLVAQHGEPYALARTFNSLDSAGQDAALGRLADNLGTRLPPLLLLAAGDMFTSHLEQRAPQKYQRIQAIYTGWMKKVFAILPQEFTRREAYEQHPLQAG